MARRLLVMAHWRMTPEQIKALSSDDITLMEFAFLFYERRQSETMDNLIGTMLGSTWDADELLGKFEKATSKDPFTWSLRKKRPKVTYPLSLALTQNPKYMQNLKAMATKTKNETREDPSVLNVPRGFSKHKEEFVDLSHVSPQEFLKIARRVPGYKKD